jgi:hypothetical protein
MFMRLIALTCGLAGVVLLINVFDAVELITDNRNHIVAAVMHKLDFYSYGFGSNLLIEKGDTECLRSATC